MYQQLDDSLISILTDTEKIVFALRALYKSSGYRPFKMSRFEEYALYLKNKGFLGSDQVITFNDTDGRLLALKPDVTLSIIKSTDTTAPGVRKVFYNESVYRVSSSTRRFKEITQTGLECIGDVTPYEIAEVVTLAARSLETFSEEYLLQITDLAILDAVLVEVSNAIEKRNREEFVESALAYLQAKNRHDLMRLCEEYRVRDQDTHVLVSLCTLNGRGEEVACAIESLRASEPSSALESPELSRALESFKSLVCHLKSTPLYDHMVFDFALTDNMRYYNGLVFRGYVAQACRSVLAGGQYDKMMAKMGKPAGAVGFAVYLDELEPVLDSIRKPVLGSAKEPALGSAKEPALDSIRKPALGSAKEPEDA